MCLLVVVPCVGVWSVVMESWRAAKLCIIIITRQAASCSPFRRERNAFRRGPVPPLLGPTPRFVNALEDSRHHATFHDRQLIGWHRRGPSLKPQQGAGATSAPASARKRASFRAPKPKAHTAPTDPGFLHRVHVQREAE